MISIRERAGKNLPPGAVKMPSLEEFFRLATYKEIILIEIVTAAKSVPKPTICSVKAGKQEIIAAKIATALVATAGTPTRFDFANTLGSIPSMDAA